MRANKQKLRLLVTYSSPAPYSVALFEQLQRRYPVDVHVLYLRATRAMQDEWDLIVPFSHDALTGPGKPSLCSAAVKLAGEILSGEFDVALLHGLPSIMALAPLLCLAKGLPFVIRSEANTAKERSFLKRLRNRLLLPPLVRAAGSVVIIGSSSREFWLKQGTPRRKMFLSPYSVDSGCWRKKADTFSPHRDKIRKSLGLSSEICIISVARLEKVKGFATLLEAASSLSKSGLSGRFKILLVGSGSQENVLRKMTRSLDLSGVIRFEGFRQQEELGRYYTAADVFVLPSKDEPWGLVTNEAMHFGLPIVASEAVVSGRDLVKNSISGFVVPKNSPQALASALGKLITDSAFRARAGEESLRIISAWNMENSVDGLWRAILHALGRHRKESRHISESRL